MTHVKLWMHEIKNIPAVKVFVCIKNVPVQVTKTNFIGLILLVKAIFLFLTPLNGSTAA